VGAVSYELVPSERLSTSAQHGGRANITFDVRRFESIDSTNRYLLDEARAGAPEGVVAVADHQTAGRGRQGRSWVAPPGGSLLVSVLLRPRAEHRPLVMAAAGLALADGVAAVAGFAPELKWPNDLVVESRKLAGILAEVDSDAVVVGAGCNVEWHEVPTEVTDIATACNLVAGRSVDRDALLEAYLIELGRRAARLVDVPQEYRRRLGTLGRAVRVELADGTTTGRAVDLGPSGELIVDTDDGTTLSVHAGDVVHLRDA